MNKQSLKRFSRISTAWLLSAAMLMGSLPVYAAGWAAGDSYKIDHSGKESENDEGNAVEESVIAESSVSANLIRSGELAVPQKWTVSIENGRVTASLTDKRSEETSGLNTTLMLLKGDERDYGNYISKASQKLTDGKADMSLDLSVLKNGQYQLLLWEK